MRPAREGEEELRDFCYFLLKRLKNDWDSVIGICGEEGVGKSTLSVIIGWYLDDNFEVRRNIVANPSVREVSENLLGKLPKYSPVIVDEAIKVMYKLGWQTQAQILLNTVFSVCRAQNKLALLCMPRFLDFNAYYRQHRIKIWVEVVERGRAFVFIKDRSPFIEDSWHIKENQKMLDKHLRRTKLSELSSGDFLRALRQTKTFAFEFTFNKMPEGYDKEYDALKKEVASTFDIDEVKGVARMYREACKQAVRILHTELELKQQDISKELGISIFTVNRFLSDMGLRIRDKKNASMPKT